MYSSNFNCQTGNRFQFDENSWKQKIQIFLKPHEEKETTKAAMVNSRQKVNGLG